MHADLLVQGGDIILRVQTRASSNPNALASEKELSDFLKSVEKRAFKRAVYAVRNDDAALDIVQDAMIRLAEKYADRPAAELPLVFQRILSNATMDWFRREKVRNAVMQNMSDFDGGDEDGDFDLLEALHVLEDTLGTESAADAVSRAQILWAAPSKLPVEVAKNHRPQMPAVTSTSLLQSQRTALQ